LLTRRIQEAGNIYNAVGNGELPSCYLQDRLQRLVSNVRIEAEVGDVEEQRRLGTMYDKLRTEAEAGGAYAQRKLGEMYDKLRDYKNAVEWHRRAAEQGDAVAQRYLGMMYANGWGVSKDATMAVDWYRGLPNREMRGASAA